MQALRRLTRRLLCALTLWALAGSAGAECVGRNLLDEMAADQRAALVQAAHAAPHARGLIFRATRAGREITLVGTYHLPDARHAGIVAQLKAPLARASLLLVEAGPEEEARLQQAMVSDPGLIFLRGKTLPELLPEEDWQRLSEALAAHGMPAFLASRMRPAFVAMTLSLPPCAIEDVARGGKGLDKLIIEQAGAARLPVAALEPWDTVFRIFDEIGPQDEIGMLRAAVIAAPQAEDMGATMADLYFDAEPRVIWEMARAQAVAAGMSEAEVTRQTDLSERLMMTGRNIAWMPVILEAADQGPVVVAVGALHLSGGQGLLALLEAGGWRIERLD